MYKYLILVVTVAALHSATAQCYKKLHRSAIVVDTHNDLISTASMKGMAIDSDLSGKTHSDLGRFRKGGVDVQVFSIFCDERFGKDTAFKYANIEMDSLYAVAARNPHKMTIATSPGDIRQALAQHKLAAMMGVEGGHMIEDNLSYLDSLFHRGARYLTLTWNNSTSWASSAKDETAHTVPNPKSGLNDFGRQVVRRMNALGMMVDLSHTGEQTFWDAIQITTKPVIVSHSCVYTLCASFRNIKDDQIKAVAKNGGVIQVNFYSGFLDSTYMKKLDAFFGRHKAETDSMKAAGRPPYEIEDFIFHHYSAEAQALRPPLSLLIDHIDYIARLAGVDHVGLGSDFDGISSAPRQLDGVQDLPLVTKALRKKGYSKKDIRKILGENFLRVFEANSVDVQHSL